MITSDEEEHFLACQAPCKRRRVSFHQDVILYGGGSKKDTSLTANSFRPSSEDSSPMMSSIIHQDSSDDLSRGAHLPHLVNETDNDGPKNTVANDCASFVACGDKGIHFTMPNASTTTAVYDDDDDNQADEWCYHLTTDHIQWAKRHTHNAVRLARMAILMWFKLHLTIRSYPRDSPIHIIGIFTNQSTTYRDMVLFCLPKESHITDWHALLALIRHHYMHHTHELQSLLSIAHQEQCLGVSVSPNKEKEQQKSNVSSNNDAKPSSPITMHRGSILSGEQMHDVDGPVLLFARGMRQFQSAATSEQHMHTLYEALKQTYPHVDGILFSNGHLSLFDAIDEREQQHYNWKSTMHVREQAQRFQFGEDVLQEMEQWRSRGCILTIPKGARIRIVNEQQWSSREDEYPWDVQSPPPSSSPLHQAVHVSLCGSTGMMAASPNREDQKGDDHGPMMDCDDDDGETTEGNNMIDDAATTASLAKTTQNRCSGTLCEQEEEHVLDRDVRVFALYHHLPSPHDHGEREQQATAVSTQAPLGAVSSSSVSSMTTALNLTQFLLSLSSICKNQSATTHVRYIMTDQDVHQFVNQVWFSQDEQCVGVLLGLNRIEFTRY